MRACGREMPLRPMRVFPRRPKGPVISVFCAEQMGVRSTQPGSALPQRVNFGIRTAAVLAEVLSQTTQMFAPAQHLIQLFPMPTNSATDLGTLQNSNWFGSGVNPNSNNQFDIKIDHRFSENDLLSAKYSQQNASSNSFDCFKNIADPCTA